MQLVGRDPEKLTLVSKELKNVFKEVKELNGGTSESQMSELETFIGSSAPDQVGILPPKQCNTKEAANELEVEKRKQ